MSDTEKPKLIGISSDPTISIPVERLGAPGAQLFLQAVPLLIGRDVAPEGVLTDKTLRQFVVSGRLAKEPSSVGHNGKINGAFSRNDGDCYLRVPPGAVKIRIDTNRIDTQLDFFHVEPNTMGNLGLVEFKCSAASPSEARKKFVETVYPGLDHWSYAYNVAIFVATIRVFDVVHQSTHIAFAAPYRNQVLENLANDLFLEMKPIYSMYREAKNASSDFYRFLCLYKIMEGLLGKMQGNVCKQLKAAGVTPSKEQDIVPDDPHFPGDLKRYIGTSMKAFFDKVLTAKFRDAVAHLTTSNGVLDVSSPAEIDRYAGLAFATDLCARVLINSHERLLAQLKICHAAAPFGA